MGEMLEMDEEALWKRTLRQAADAEQEKGRLTAEAARLSQLLLALADKAIAQYALPEQPAGHALLPAAVRSAPTPPSNRGGVAFDIRGGRRKVAAGEEGEPKRLKLSVSAEGPKGEVLLPNWFAASEDGGGIYYFNASTDETSWEVPLRWPRAEATAEAATDEMEV